MTNKQLQAGKKIKMTLVYKYYYFRLCFITDFDGEIGLLVLYAKFNHILM